MFATASAFKGEMSTIGIHIYVVLRGRDESTTENLRLAIGLAFTPVFARYFLSSTRKVFGIIRKGSSRFKSNGCRKAK